MGNAGGPPFIFHNGVITNIDPLAPGIVTHGRGVSNSGNVTGSVWLSPYPTQIQHAFVYSGGVTKDIGTLGGKHSHGMLVNDPGDVAGVSDTAAGVRTPRIKTKQTRSIPQALSTYRTLTAQPYYTLKVKNYRPLSQYPLRIITVFRLQEIR